MADKQISVAPGLEVGHLDGRDGMRKLLLGFGLIVVTLTACDTGRPVSTSIVLPTPTIVRVLCYYDGEVIFDQPFERAETLENGMVRVWIGVEYVDMEGDCKVAVTAPTP